MGFGGSLDFALYLPLDNVDLDRGGEDDVTNDDRFATDVDAKK